MKLWMLANTTVEDINIALFARVPGKLIEYNSCDVISSSMNYVANAYVLYSLEILHLIVLAIFLDIKSN